MAEQQSDRTKEQWIDKGLAHIHQRGQGNEALDAFEHALGLEPTDIVANLGKGHSLWKLGRTEEARAIYEQFLPGSNRCPGLLSERLCALLPSTVPGGAGSV